MGKSGEIPALFRSGHGVPERISPNAIQIRPPALGVHLSYIEGRLAQRHGELEPSYDCHPPWPTPGRFLRAPPRSAHPHGGAMMFKGTDTHCVQAVSTCDFTEGVNFLRPEWF